MMSYTVLGFYLDLVDGDMSMVSRDILVEHRDGTCYSHDDQRLACQNGEYHRAENRR